MFGDYHIPIFRDCKHYFYITEINFKLKYFLIYHLQKRNIPTMKSRQIIFQRLKKEAEATKSYQKLADRIGVNYVTLWRVIASESNGNIRFWDKVFEYYGK